MLLSTSTNTNNNQDSESEPESSVDAPNDAGEQEDRRRVVAESVEPEGISGRAERGQQQEPNGHEDRIADSEPPSERQPSKSAEPEAQANEAQQPAEEEEDEATLDAWAAFSDEYHDSKSRAVMCVVFSILNASGVPACLSVHSGRATSLRGSARFPTHQRDGARHQQIPQLAAVFLDHLSRGLSTERAGSSRF